MRKLIIIATIIVFAQSLIAQVKIGAVAAYGISTSQSESIMLGTKDGRRAAEVGFVQHESAPSVGLALTADFGPLFATGEIHYRRNAYTLQIQNYLRIDEPMNYLEETSSVIHVPITGGVKFGKFRLGVGPTFNLHTNHSQGGLKLHNIEERKRNLQMGFAGSLGLDITNHIRMGVKYEKSFSRIGDDYRYAGKQLKLGSSLDYLTFNVGYFF